MRKGPLLLAPAAVVTTLVAGVASAVADQVVSVRRRPRYHQRVLAVAGDEVTLARDAGTQRRGSYGLAWPGGHAVVGDVVRATQSSVTRPVVRVDYGTLAPGKVVLDHVDIGDPRRAFGLDFVEVSLTSDVGVLPAWEIEGSGDAWAVLVHGYGGRRASSLSFLPMLLELGLNIVVPAYRNDPDAPPSPDNRYHLGATEWRDLEAAIDHIVERGGRRVIVFGWSMGGAIALQHLAQTTHADVVVGLILDSPVLDWRDVLLHISRRRHVPEAIARFALTLVEKRIGVDFDDLDWVGRAEELATAMLVVTGDDDLTVPCGRAVELARLRPDLVEFRLVENAGHVGSWNVDPVGYASSVRDFVTRVLAPATA